MQIVLYGKIYIRYLERHTALSCLKEGLFRSGTGFGAKKSPWSLKRHLKDSKSAFCKDGNYSETSIKRTPCIKRTLSRVPKLTSYITLYNEPLFNGHLY